ncbi:MAG: hypothetical protein ISS48_00100 [Candidatus Aenigmarchaeota archaeon]|nr:hypothetical protein [Candidatus Aenigmarchaeota archaeon]
MKEGMFMQHQENSSKCWKCNIKMKEVKRILPVVGIEYSSFKCFKCRKSIVSMWQLHELSRFF